MLPVIGALSMVTTAAKSIRARKAGRQLAPCSIPISFDVQRYRAVYSCLQRSAGPDRWANEIRLKAPLLAQEPVKRRVTSPFV